MKKLFQTILAGVCLLCAQSPLWAQTATLYHEYDQANPITFTGADAFVDAVANASSGYGDEIILSSGTFNGCDVWQSNLKVYGVGAECDDPTIITNSGTIYGNYERWEGILLSGSTIVSSEYSIFLKCRFENLTTTNDMNYWGSRYYDCRFDYLNISNEYYKYFYNCIISQIWCENGNEVHFYNCILSNGGINSWDIYFEGCILYDMVDTMGNPTGFQKNRLKGSLVLTDADADLLSDNRNRYNTQLPLSSVSNIFTDFDGSNATSASFMLTADAQSRYTDALGRTVGVYAGQYPYSMAVEAPTRLDSSVEILSVENGFADVHVKIDVVKK